MLKVKLTITESKCRDGCCIKGKEYIFDNVCPPICAELWNSIYPYIFTLQNGGSLDCGDKRVKYFDAKCPDDSRVWIHGEVIDN